MPQQLDSQVAAILQARHDNPFSFLGMHHCGGGICVRAILPDAQQMAVVDSATGNIAAEGVRSPGWLLCRHDCRPA